MPGKSSLSLHSATDAAVAGPSAMIRRPGSIKNRPPAFSLEQNYPNPFNPSTTIHYSLREKGYVQLKMFDLAGHEIETLVCGTQESGEQELNWTPSGLAGGIYVYRLEADGHMDIKKLLYLK